MKKTWVSIAEALGPNEDPVACRVLADLVIEAGDQEKLAELLRDKVLEARSWWEQHEQDVMLDLINEADDGRAVIEYRAILAKIEVLRLIADWVFAA